MKVSIAFLTWTVAIFIWLYLLPILFIGTIICIPFFIIITPIIMIITCTMAYFIKDEIIPTGYIRSVVNNIPYNLWFGHIDDICAPAKPTLICSHPHGILCTGILFSVHFRPGSSTLFAVSKWLFYIPVIGWLATQLGCIPATYYNINTALKTNSVILVPGGVPELISGKQYTRRYGFLKIAKKKKVPILPVTTKQTFFNRIPCPWESARIHIANKYGLPIMFPVLGWYGTWLPKRRPIHMKTHPSRYIEQDIEQERQTYYKSIDKDT